MTSSGSGTSKVSTVFSKVDSLLLMSVSTRIVPNPSRSGLVHAARNPFWTQQNPAVSSGAREDTHAPSSDLPTSNLGAPLRDCPVLRDDRSLGGHG